MTTATRINVRVPVEVAEFLERVADAFTGGNISQVVLRLIQGHGEEWVKREAEKRKLLIDSGALGMPRQPKSDKSGG